jgi:polyisoprenoid-binding protein YceI
MMKPLLLTAAVLLSGATVNAVTAAPSAPARWVTDAAHTSVEFDARHFFTKVRGAFRQADIDFQYDEANPQNSSVNATMRVASVSTGNEKRDAHLRTGDWFDADKYPVIRFRSERVEAISPEELRVHGVLTIRDVSRRVVLPVRRTGVQDVPAPMQKMMGGATRIAGFETSLTIDRTDFGVGSGDWAMTTVVGAPIEIHISMEAHRK